MIYFAILVVLLLPVAFILYREIVGKFMYLWLPAYAARLGSRLPDGKKHVMFCFVDHFEPQWNRPDKQLADARVQRWMDKYPQFASRFQDADGQHPKHTFFFPEEEYRQEHLAKLSDLCARGYGELEIHLHHHDDTEHGLREKINSFIDLLHKQHGALPVDPKTGKPVFAFIHGNWALDNSAAHGHHCGINNELVVLKDLGCYCDFTFPSAPSETQTRKINSIYYAVDDPDKPKSHDSGTDLKVGGKESGDLMLLQGPLGLNWQWLKWGILPRTENGDIRANSPPLPCRVDAWIKQHVHVQGRPEWIFVKIHTHGSQENSERALLGDQIVAMHTHLRDRYNDGREYALHYVSAREMYNIAKAAEAGKTGDPNQYRDFVLPKPAFKTLPA